VENRPFALNNISTGKLPIQSGIQNDLEDNRPRAVSVHTVGP